MRLNIELTNLEANALKKLCDKETELGKIYYKEAIKAKQYPKDDDKRGNLGYVKYLRNEGKEMDYKCLALLKILETIK